MTFCEQAWAVTSSVRAEIDHLPFLRQLAAGTLPSAVFLDYLTQDAIYLRDYARVLAAAASLATVPAEVAFWATCATTAVTVESQLHESHGVDAAAPASPTCATYLGWLWELVSAAEYPRLVAGVLPCFWVYQDVGERLHARAFSSAHPYADWLATYADPAFAAATAQARAISDRAAADADPAAVQDMLQTFAVGVEHERDFWRAVG
ncbi:MAG TPA: TenA family protein [Dermatophilaceae bacterium]|nr:TenA family protein [Dermatophilaceae bacterium]